MMDLPIAKYMRHLASLLINKNVYYIMTLVFLHYTYLKIKKIMELKIEIKSIPNIIIKQFVEQYFIERKLYVDYSSCGLGIMNSVILSDEPLWINICSSTSQKKYKILLLPFSKHENMKIYVSETMIYNMEKLLQNKNHESYFIMPAYRSLSTWAEEAKISLISNPFEIQSDLTDALLKNYFLNPRYLRKNDIITIPIKEYAPEYSLTLPNPQLTVTYFWIEYIKINGKKTNEPCYIFRDKTTLVQAGVVHDYLPPNYTCPISQHTISNFEEQIQMDCISNLPESLYRPFEELRSSIRPFMISSNWMEIKPIFLVKGPPGCGKFQLIHCLAKQLGFNFLNLDCSEIHTLTPSQTEAKLRSALYNAENSLPCILKIKNIQVYGRNFEGKIDERVTSNFIEQLKILYRKKIRKYPLIIIATLENGEMPPDLNRHFIETITIDYFTQSERIQLLEWILKRHKIKYHADLTKIASMSSDFVYQDLEILIFHAMIKRYERTLDEHGTAMIINDNDFIHAYQYMQSIFSDRIGTAKVPEVHWEDIGGLSCLRHEIIRRIEIPLKHNLAIRRSGILLYGPPGTGKTLLAKAVATECKLNFLSVKGPELLNMYVGQSEKNVRDIFDRARAASPCIIFFDELDALAPNRGRSGDSGGVMDRVVSQLLAEMDGLDSSANTFIIGATNRPDLIDPALLRPGRFDKLLYVGVYSSPESQLSVLKAITRKFTIEKNNDGWERIVKELPRNLTGADLYSVCANAWLNAARRIITNNKDAFDERHTMDNTDDENKIDGPINVLFDDFLHAIRKLVPSVSIEELIRYEMLHKQLAPKQSES